MAFGPQARSSESEEKAASRRYHARCQACTARATACFHPHQLTDDARGINLAAAVPVRRHPGTDRGPVRLSAQSLCSMPGLEILRHTQCDDDAPGLERGTGRCPQAQGRGQARSPAVPRIGRHQAGRTGVSMGRGLIPVSEREAQRKSRTVVAFELDLSAKLLG